MSRAAKKRAQQLFTASSKKGEQVRSDLEKYRQARVALTAKLREQRHAREEADRNGELLSEKEKSGAGG